MTRQLKVLALAGGVGGAKLVAGLDSALPEGALTTIVNTGDDFVHWGLDISPDLDTVMYTLAGVSNKTHGWGLENETFDTLEAMKRLGRPAWFALGDKDLGTHLCRTQLKKDGVSLTDITARLCESFGVARKILPMSDDPCPTLVHSDEGVLSFQDWLVKRRAQPRVRKIESAGDAAATPNVLSAIDEADLVVVCPSNPFVSIDPILSLPGLRKRLEAKRTIAVSPIVAGKTLKGPLGAMIESISGQKPSAAAVGNHYGSIIDAIVVQHGDTADTEHVHQSDTVMKTHKDRLRLAEEILDFAERIR